MRFNIISLTIITLTLVLSCQPKEKSNQTLIDKHGLLQVKGNKIVDKNDSVASFAGMSFFWSNWGGHFYTDSVVHWLNKDWNCNIVRAAMGIEGNPEGPGYLEAPETEKAKIETIVEACIDLGIYVIIDWHDHNAHLHQNEAIEFFTYMAKKYGNQPNIIYEIFNEPEKISWVDDIKPYAETVIDSIRKYDPNNLIIVGTRQWSQMVTDVIGNEINDNNVAYVMHFYVGSHGQWLRDETKKAIDAGIPVFVSEWGVWGDHAEIGIWNKFMKDNNLINCNWSVIDKEEPSSPLKLGSSTKGNWTENDLTVVGKQVRNYMIHWKDKEVPDLKLKGDNE